jgi:hypothetical protein
MKCKSSIKNSVYERTKKKLADHKQIECDRELAIQELTEALQTMPNNKSTGKDGLTKEFYKTF